MLVLFDGILLEENYGKSLRSHGRIAAKSINRLDTYMRLHQRMSM